MVGGFDRGLGAGQGGGDVAVVFLVAAWPGLGGQVVAPAVAGKVGGHRPHLAIGAGRLPVHLQRFHGALGVPPALGDHRHRAGQLVHRVHAFHGFDLVFVAQAAYGHAQAWRVLHGGVEHAVDLDVDAVDRLAGGLVVGVEALHRLADPAELAGVAQRDAGRVRHRQVHGLGGQFAIAQLTARSRVHDLAGLRCQFTDRNPPLRGTGLQQHGPGQGAEAAHGRVAHAHRHAAAGDAPTVFHHHVGFPRWRTVDHEGGRVGIQLLADDLRHGGIDALPSFHERAEQVHAAVWANFQEGRHLGAAFAGGRGGLDPWRAQWQPEAQHQRANGGAGEEAPARQVDGFAVAQAKQVVRGIDTRVHQAFSPWARSCTAAWMAL